MSGGDRGFDGFYYLLDARAHYASEIRDLPIRLLVRNKYVFCAFLSMMIDGPMTHQEPNHYVNLFRLAFGLWLLAAPAKPA
jgi:hypothetical protein